ncbi:S24 family peptidase [Salmonella enterica]
MGFPSPATDFLEQGISFDRELIPVPSATYFLRYDSTSWREGIKRGALLLVDTSLTPCSGSLVMCHIDEKIRALRFRLHPEPHLEELDKPEKFYPLASEDYEERVVVKGVIRYIINDAMTGEFDDLPVI